MAADKTFTDFLKSAPPAREALGGKTAVVSGTVYRGEADDKFVLATSDGQTTEVPVEAVQRFKLVDQTGLNAIVQLEINVGSLGHHWHTLKELIKDPLHDTRKELIYDTRKELAKDPIIDTYKEVIKEPIKEPIWDPPGTLWGDPPGGTLQEGIDWGDPSQGVVNPAVGMQGQFGQQQQMQQHMHQHAGMMPFIMATPHHASAAAVAMQPGPQIATSYVADHVTPKPVYSDHKTVYSDPITRKELTWDTQKEPIFDPQTRWENGGGFTMQEGVGNPGQFEQPVWNLPGQMF